MGRRAVLLRMFTHTAGQNNIKQVQFLAFYLFIHFIVIHKFQEITIRDFALWFSDVLW